MVIAVCLTYVSSSQEFLGRLLFKASCLTGGRAVNWSAHKVTFLPTFSICSEGRNIADPVTASPFLQGHIGMSQRANSFKDSLDPPHLVFGESTLLCVVSHLFIFAPMLWTAEIVSHIRNKNQQVACMSFLLLLPQPIFPVFYFFSHWQLPPWSPIPAFLTLSTGSLFAEVQWPVSWALMEFCAAFLSFTCDTITGAAQALQDAQWYDLTYWDDVAFVPCLDMVPWTWRVFSNLLASSCLFWSICCYNAVGFLLQPQMLNHWSAEMIQPVL